MRTDSIDRNQAGELVVHMLSVSAIVVLLLCAGCTDPDRQSNEATNVRANSPASASVPAGMSAESVAAPPTDAGNTDKDMNPTTDAVDDQSAETYIGRNRLSESTSPYLLQHQHNPVHWFEWGDDAFEAARTLNRPIFLSIGYSTCYWCHVMERESFEDDEVAAVLNEKFIAIKVDREERPDVDEIYMTSCQYYTRMTTGRASGGWPLTVLLEPESLKPFFAGTYYPKPQFMSLLDQVARVWVDNRTGIEADATNLARVIEQQYMEAPTPVALTRQLVDQTVTLILAGYDQLHGGFRRGGPKFPMPSQLDLLMEAGWDLASAQAAVTHTLDRMATGGMYDQVGGGFHRYSVDEKWLVPHFEKMLYDNGQLAATYARAYELTGDQYYAEIVRETLDYAMREMRDSGGGFWSAQDAEVNHREGQNYIWTSDEVAEALRAAGHEEEIEFALRVYGLDQGTNFTDPHHPDDGPRNVLFLAATPAMLAEQIGISIEEFKARLAALNSVLYEARMNRDQPITDDKVLASWNGLMMHGLAEGGRVLDDARYLEAAHEVAAFILSTMRAGDGGLLHTYRDGDARIEGLLEDYAQVIRGLISLHRATGDPWPLDQARALLDEANERFLDENAGGYFDTQAGQSDLFVRTRSVFDGAIPSGNTTMALNLVDLASLTGEATHADLAKRSLDYLSARFAQNGTGMPVGVLALSRFVGDAGETEVAGAATEPLNAPAQRSGVVTVHVEPEELQLAAGASGEFTLTLSIADGYHINSHEPGHEMLIPLNLTLVGGDGLDLMVDYPAGDLLDGPVGAANVHDGTVEIMLRVKRSGEITGRPEIVLTYQACDDRQCLMPVTEPLPVRFRAD